MKSANDESNVLLIFGCLELAKRILTQYAIEKPAIANDIELLQKDLRLSLKRTNLQDDQTCLDMLNFLQDFIEESFWEQLILKLSEKDVRLHFKIDSIEELNVERRIQETAEFEHKWANEFEKHGLSRIGIIDIN